MARICSIAIAFLLTIINVTMAAESWENPQTYFGTKAANITWAHRVNSKKLLNEALSNKKIMMLEADVNLLPSKNNTPMMAHEPNDTSDLELDEFLKTIVEKKGKQGIKLDFKSTNAFNASLSVLKKYQTNITFPVLLNADILVGPNKPTATPVDGKKFLEGGSKVLPKSIFSLGWTTGNGTANYTAENVKEMIQLINAEKISQPITYPVRASLAVNSVSVLVNLLNSTAKNNATLSIWSVPGDSYNATALDKLIKEVGVDKVYVDVPEKKSPNSGSLRQVSIIGTVLTAGLLVYRGDF